MNLRDILAENLAVRIQLLRLTEQKDEALSAYDQLLSLKEALQHADLNTRLAEKQDSYDDSFMEQQITKLQEAGLIKDSYISWLYTLLGLGLLIVIFFVIRTILLSQAKKQANRERERELFLRKENHHRVKNHLQALLSQINIMNRKTSSTAIQENLEVLKNQVGLIGRIQKKLLFEDTGQPIPVADDLIEIVTNLTQVFSDGAHSIVCDLAIDEQLRLNADQANNLGLLINEIVTNACKHALKDHANPILTMKLQLFDGQSALLDLADNGGTTTEEERESMHRGLGSSVIKAFSKRLKGQLTMDYSDGFRYILKFPLNQAQKRNHPD